MRSHAPLALGARLAAALLLLGGEAAGAHGGGGDGLRPVLDPLPRALAGMRVELRDTLGWQLVLANPTPRTVEVLDAEGVPFLRIGPDGVEGNLASATWYRTLGPASALPAALAPGAAPRWRRARAEPSAGWFDPRLAAGDGPSHRAGGAARWEVPLRIAGERVALSGRFRAEPPPAGRYTARLTSPAEPAPGVLVTLLPGRAPGLLVRNASGRTLVVFGADGEPFLRIAPNGVDANLESGTWQRSARSASTPAVVPVTHAVAPSEAGGPAWRRVSNVPRFAWIEPRAVVTGAPAGAAPAADVLEWTVPMQLGEERLRVTGVVSWRPASR